MKNEEFISTLYKAAVRQPHSIVIAQRILSERSLEQILMRCGTGRLIIVVCGEAGNGKTSSIRAVIGEHDEIKFAMGLKEVKKKIFQMTDRGSNRWIRILFLDNFPQTLSEYKAKVGAGVLDHVVDVVSEDTGAPLIVISGEMNIVPLLKKKDNLAGRTLLVRMPSIDGDKELYGIRKCLVENQQEYLNLWKDYENWAENHPADELEVQSELERFRENYFGRYSSRQINLVFCYYYAMKRLSSFLFDRYGKGISLNDLEKNVRELFEWEKSSDCSRHSYEIDVWNEFVSDNGIRKVWMPGEAVCRCLLEECCDEFPKYRCRWCNGDGVDCGMYNPMELRMPEDPAGTVLIEDVKLISDFPRHIVCNSPILAIRRDSLLQMLNEYLETYSRKKNCSVNRITPNRLTRELYLHNLCLFEYVGIRHNTYTFRMKDRRNNDVRVVFIKLTKKQYQKLKAVARPVNCMVNYDEKEVIDMNACLRDFCENVQSLIGDVGTVSRGLIDDEEIFSKRKKRIGNERQKNQHI